MRVRATFVVGVAFAIACSALPSGSSASAHPTSHTTGVRAAEFERQEVFRQEHGLSLDPGLVSALNEGTLRSAEEAAETWGLPLTNEEMTRLAYFIDIQSQLRQIQNRAEQLPPDAYAGTYVDLTGAGVIYVGFTRDGASLVEQVREGLPHPEAVKPFKAKHSLSTLFALQAGYRAHAGETATAPVRAVNVRVDTNRIEVSLATFDGQIATALMAEAEANGLPVSFSVLGPELKGTIENHTRDDYIYNIRAGLEIWYTLPSGNSTYCTSNMTGYDADYPNLRFVLTAGHCGNEGTEFRFQGGSGFGNVTRRHYGGFSDASAIRLDNSDRDAYGIFINDDSVREVLRRDGAVQGQDICVSGATTYYQCGTVYDAYFDFSYGENWYNFIQIGRAVDTDGGDSGAPYFHGHTVYGLHHGTQISADGNGRATGSRIGNVVPDLNLTSIKVANGFD